MAVRSRARGTSLLAWLAIVTSAAGLGAAELPNDRGVGLRMANFTLNNVAGRPVSLYGYRGKKAVVLAFLGIDCPVSNLYVPRLVELNKAYSDKGVVFLAINSNARETVEQVAKHASEHGIDFPVLKDPGNRVADQCLAERTCEVLVLDGHAMLRYRGAIDDQYGTGTRKDAPARSYLRDAIDAVIADRPVEPAATPVAGCLLDRMAPQSLVSRAPRVRPAPAEVVTALEERERSEPASTGNVTFATDVAPIIQGKCQSCHRPGQAAPYSMASYDDVRRHAAMVREVVEDRRMPPWHADPRFGRFANDRSLTPRERATLLAWVDQGAPLGDPKALPAPKAFPEGWTIGTPDVVLEIPKPYVVAAQGTLDYVYLRVPRPFAEDRWVQAAEARPDDRSVVHHIVVYIDDHDPKSSNPLRHHLCGYAPGDMPSVYPPGTAKKIPAGSDLIFQLHYTPDGKIHTDRSKLGLIFAKAPVTHEAFTLGVAQTRFLIPPGAENHPVTSSFTFPSDSHLLSFMPHMHLRGKDFRYTATYPDGRKETLLSVPAYDFGWQSYYTLAESKAMPKGTRIDCLAHFDNSASNPVNPDPTRAVTWGDQTFEEMMIGYIDFVQDDPIAPQSPSARVEKTAAAGR